MRRQFFFKGTVWKFLWIEPGGVEAWKTRAGLWHIWERNFSLELKRGLPRRILRFGRIILIQVYWEEGIDLREAISQGWPVGRLLEGFRSALERLSLLEESAPNLLHGDLSPANLLLTPIGNSLWIDWETSRAVAEVKRERRLFVKPAERAQGWSPRKESDIFSLGAILFELLSGSTLFQDDMEGFRASASFQFFYLENVIGNIPREYRHVLARALSPDWAARPSRYSEFLQEFDRAFSERKILGAMAEQSRGAK